MRARRSIERRSQRQGVAAEAGRPLLQSSFTCRRAFACSTRVRSITGNFGPNRRPNSTIARSIFPVAGGGRSSAINSMIAIRGNPQDYDSWEAQGCRGWGYENLPPLPKKIEDAAQVTSQPDRDRGYSGPIRLSYGVLQHPISKAFIESAKSAGLPENNGFNGPSQMGAGFYELTISDGKRSGAFKFSTRGKDEAI